MRVFDVLAVICIAGPIYAIPTKFRYEDEILHSPESIACAREANFDFASFKKEAVNIPNPPPPGYELPREVYCYTSCIMMNDWKRKDPNIDSFEKGFTEMSKHADDILEYTAFTRKDIEVVLNKCANKGLNNCDYLRCIKLFEPPVFTLLYQG